jgi:hypothetical protein
VPLRRAGDDPNGRPLRGFDRFSALEEEWRGQRVGPLLADEMIAQLEPILRRRAGALGFLPQDAEERRRDLGQEFLVHMTGGRLDELFLHAEDLDHLRLLLRARARQFMANQLRRAQFENVWRRVLAELNRNTEVFESTASGGIPRWVNRGRRLPSYTANESELREFARSLRIPPSMARLRRDTATAPVVLDTPDLRALLEEIMENVGWALGIQDLRTVLQERLGLWEVETVSISRQVGPGATLEELLGANSAELAHAEVRLLVKDAKALLTVRQLVVLGMRYGEKRTRDYVARALGVGNGTVTNEAERAARVLLDVAEGDFGLAGQLLGELLDQWTAV